MENLTWTLLFAGALAGLINFFVIYVNLPFQPTATEALAEGREALKDNIYLAIAGYIIVGIGGAMLTITINAIVGLRGLEKFEGPHLDQIVFGYGLIFGYSTTRLLLSLLDALLKRMAAVEAKAK